ncbi:MAG TPA: hypothetical protein VMS22_05270 [Candidatus Eisenbacteria bacterium]|nr:hypothetical protein [Candidatus Eisenbacteria bacterium]
MLSADAAGAATPGRVCRSACAPRIAEQCQGLPRGRELRRCRRPLIRACKASTPEVACPTTNDLREALNDQLLRISSGRTLLLCADGGFVLSEDPTGPLPAPFLRRFTGTWDVEVAERRALAIALDVVNPFTKLETARDGAGGFIVDGTPAPASDGAAECAARNEPPPPPTTIPNPPDPNDPERVLAVSLALADRRAIRHFENAGGIEVEKQLTFCSSGLLEVTTLVHLSNSTIDASSDRGTWSLDPAGAVLSLALGDGSADTGSIEVALQDGHVAIGGEVVDLLDQRGFCDDVALQERLTAAVSGSVYLFRLRPGSPLRSTLALCDSGSYTFRGIAPNERGRWFVEVRDGAAELQLVDDDAGDVRRFAMTEGADGVTRVDGDRPLTDPSDTLAAQCS